MKAGDTTIAAWKMALKNRPVKQDLLFHSDTGVQANPMPSHRQVCCLYRFQRAVERIACLAKHEQKRKWTLDAPDLNHVYRGVRSNRQVRWDNAVAESFFKTLKTELVYHTDYPTKQQAKLSILEYIEGWYNRKRRHGALGNRNPEQYQSRLEQERLAA